MGMYHQKRANISQTVNHLVDKNWSIGNQKIIQILKSKNDFNKLRRFGSTIKCCQFFFYLKIIIDMLIKYSIIGV